MITNKLSRVLVLTMPERLQALWEFMINPNKKVEEVIAMEGTTVESTVGQSNLKIVSDD